MIETPQLTAGEPQLDRTIESLQVGAADRHSRFRLLRRPVGVPFQWDSVAIGPGRQDQGVRLVDGILKIVGGDRQRVRVSVKNIAKGIRRRTLTSDANPVAEHPETLDSHLDAQQRRRRTSRSGSGSESAGVTHTGSMRGSEVSGSTSQTTFNSSPDDSGSAVSELGDQSLNPPQERDVHENWEADTTGLFGHG